MIIKFITKNKINNVKDRIGFVYNLKSYDDVFYNDLYGLKINTVLISDDNIDFNKLPVFDIFLKIEYKLPIINLLRIFRYKGFDIISDKHFYKYIDKPHKGKVVVLSYYEEDKIRLTIYNNFYNNGIDDELSNYILDKFTILDLGNYKIKNYTIKQVNYFWHSKKVKYLRLSEILDNKFNLDARIKSFRQ